MCSLFLLLIPFCIDVLNYLNALEYFTEHFFLPISCQRRKQYFVYIKYVVLYFQKLFCDKVPLTRPTFQVPKLSVSSVNFSLPLLQEKSKYLLFQDFETIPEYYMWLSFILANLQVYIMLLDENCTLLQILFWNIFMVSLWHTFCNVLRNGIIKIGFGICRTQLTI